MPTFNRNDTNAILAFFGQTSTRGSTQPRDEAYYTSNRPASTRRPSSNVVTPTTAPGGLPPRRSSSTVPRDEQYYTTAKPTYKPPAAPKIKRKSSQPADEEYYTTNDPPNRWRQEIQQPVFRGYDVGPGPQVNVSVGQRPNTGATNIQQSGAIGGQTVRSPITPRLPAYSGPADDAFYTQRDAPSAPLRTPGQPPVAMAPSVLPVARAAWDMIPDSWDEAGQLARYGLQGWWGTVGDTAAVERAQSDIAARNQAFGERERSNWRDLGQSFGNAWDAMGDNRELIQREAGEWWRGEQPLTQALTDYASGVSISPAYEPLWRAADINTVTANAARMANNLATGLQGAQDLVYNQPWLPNNKALSDYMTPALETLQSDEAKRLLLAPSLGQDLGQAWQQFSQRFTRNFDAYQQAITPDAEQAKRLQPGEAQQQADRARLRSLAGSEFVGNVFDKLVNQQQNVDSLNQQALTLFQQGAQAIDEDLRQELWQKAAQLGADAYQLKSSHPIQLVNEGFSAQELLSQLVLPDVTDLAGGLFSVLQLTPKARRLTSTVNEVMTPQKQAVNALQEMIVTPATRTAMQAQRSDYNKLWNLWTTGNARANIATDKMVRYVVNLLGDAETPGDARLLLNQLATDPTKLVTGMAANVFQSPGLLARANEKGLVQFGAMNLQNLKEPLRVYQQAAENILNNSVALATSGPVLDKLSFVNEFMDGMRQAGYRFYNVADDAASVPLGAKTSRLRAVTGGQYVVEWVDGSKKVIGQSDPMLIQDARKLQNSFKGGQVTAPQSVINKAGSAMRKVVSIPYILGNPGTWVTNAVSGMATAVGDGVWSTATNRVMDEWKTKVFGIDPTVRGLEGADTAQGFAQNTMGGGVFSFLRNKYGQIDENAGRRVWHSSTQHALRRAGKPILQQTLTPILQGMGITNARQIKRITNHLFEVGYRGGDMVGEWARLMNGNARVFSLSDVNPQWLGALSEPVLEQFYDILKTATTKEDAVTRLQAWTDSATKYWDDLLDGQTVTPQRHVWMKQETAQDAADLTQTARVAQKYGNVPADEVAAWTKQTATAMQDSQRRMETLMQLIADAKDPRNRYALYNVWGQVTDLTADVRGQLLDLAEKAGQTPAGAARQSAWGQYWTEARRLWDGRNTAVNNLLEQTAQAVTSGQDFTPHLDVWRTLERSAQVNEAKLWDALRLEPQSGAYDQRLRQVIDAGRQIADKSMSRVYAAARRFANVDAMDYIISAEHSVQTAGGQARAYLDKVLEKALKSGKWEDYYSIRNETWRQLRAYERDVWGIAERSIVQDGLASEATTGLRFDAGPDGTVELLRPEQRTVQQTSRMGPEKTVTQRQVTEWAVKREDGTVTTVPDNMVPKELKDRYNGVTPEEIEAQTQLELDNIASAEPFSEEATQLLSDTPPPMRLVEPAEAPPTQAVQQPATPAFTPSTQAADVEGFARFTATEPPTNAVEVRTVTPAQATPLTLNDLRRLADEAGIQTASEAGQPINKRLLNTINKDLKIKATRLEDLTPDQIEQAAEALRKRASAAAAAASPTVPTAPAKPALAKSAEGFTAGDIKRGWQDYAYEYKVPPIDEIAARVKAGKQPLPKKQMDALSGLTIAGVKITDQESVRRLVQQYIDLSENRRTLEFTVPVPDMEKWARENVAKSLNLSADLKPQAMATKAPVSAGDLGQGAAFAKQQIQNIYNHVVANLDEILTPQRGIGQGQSLRAVDEFRTRVLPAWDNAKYIASEYGNRMRGFTMVDFANNTRLDELLSLYMPYGFWMTRTAKNSLERAIFQPQIWRRVMQTEQGVRDIQEQRGDPQRYEGAMPYDDGSGIVQYLRLLPSKYWQAAGLFTHNDYADPESANSALGFAVDSLRAANLNSYPWFDIGAKLADGEANDIYPVNYIPAARWISDLAIMAGGQGAANRWTVPGYFENSVARTLNNMAVKGEITKEQARWAHDLLWQQKQGGQPLPEQSTGANMEEISAILDTAMRTAAGQDFQGSFTSWLSGVGVRPFDQAENTWTGAQQEYYENQYGPQNPYGSHLASQAVRDDAVLNWSKSGVWKPEEGRPGQMLVNDLKKQEKESVNQDLMSATDAWILAQKEPPTNGEINDFKAQYVIGKYGDQDVQPAGDFKYPFFADVITTYLDNKYPSAQPFEGDGGPRYQGYAPEETREKVRTAAYYQALDELEDEKPTSPGKGKSREEYKAYDEDKRAYEAELEARVTELISDPQWLAIQAGTFLRTTRTGESEGSYRLLAPTMDNAFTSPQRPTGDATDPYMSGLVPLAGSPADAKAIIEQEKTKYMGPVEKATRAANEENGDKSGRFYARGNRRYSSRSSRRYSRGGGGYRRSYGGGGGFRYTDMPQAQGLSSSLWSQDDVRAWRPWNNQANDWLRSGQELRPDRLEDWRPLRV